MAEQKNANRLISNNKKAYFDYFIEDKYEAGLVLHGTEVKSIRMGKCSIKEAYIQIQNGEVFINNMNITPYEKGNIFNKDPLRPKKLLLHQSEINKLAGQISAFGYIGAVVIAALYLDGGMEVARNFILPFITEGKTAEDDYKTRLQEVVQQDPSAVLKYEVTGETGPDHNKQFTVCVWRNGELLAEGRGRSKKAAEQHAAKVALEKLQ